MLIQISCMYILRPFYFSFIRHKLSGHNIHKGRFSLAVGTDETDMFPLQQAKRYIVKNSTVSKSVGQVFYV